MSERVSKKSNVESDFPDGELNRLPQNNCCLWSAGEEQRNNQLLQSSHGNCRKDTRSSSPILKPKCVDITKEQKKKTRMDV